ncbi:hypothetical protein ANANG_G00149060 [Anguilla anguilla]|uniref:Uncharacterized protein n=1 Tax=Anguilla anguilla TaxID=7936 RepID=A0A9D3M6A9_ANGAN|nr:hypothetical protein ANANG_G00149060 [Anguilla anguilla]
MKEQVKPISQDGLDFGKPEATGGLWDSLKKAAFIIGSGIFLLAAFGNSITWHLQRFWGASGDFWQTQWTKLHLLFGGYEWALFFMGSMIVPTAAFWLFNALLMLADSTGGPSSSPATGSRWTRTVRSTRRSCGTR